MRRVDIRAVLAVFAVAASTVVVAAGTATADTSGAVDRGWERACADAPAGRFPDVPAGNVHATAVDCAAAHGIVRGFADGTYRPAAAVTRGQMATYIADLMRERYEFRLPVPNAFADDDGNPHEFAIDLLASVGVVHGVGPDTYAPGAPVTRAQMATYLIRAFETATDGLMPEARDAFVDDDGTSHEPNIDRAAAGALASGTSVSTYAPGAPVRRDQMATFVVRTLGCLSLAADDPSCASYAGGGIDGFELQVTVDGTHHAAGSPVALRVEACNRRDATLQQRFPQRDWATIELSNPSLSAGSASQLNWYDARLGSLAGAGYGPERDTDVVWHRLASREPRTAVVTWVDGPQASPDEVVTWRPGECKRLAVPAWRQRDNVRWPSGHGTWVADWSAEPPTNGRARPGPYVARVHWGGVEVGSARRYVSADSERFTIEGPAIDVRLAARAYRPGEPIGIITEACNPSPVRYDEPWVDDGSTAQQVLSLSARVPSQRTPVVVDRIWHPAGSTLTWAAGECKTWTSTWDLRDDAGQPHGGDSVSFEVLWHDGAGPVERWQQVQSPILWLR